jgi:hypothetical protein
MPHTNLRYELSATVALRNIASADAVSDCDTDHPAAPNDVQPASFTYGSSIAVVDDRTVPTKAPARERFAPPAQATRQYGLRACDMPGHGVPRADSLHPSSPESLDARDRGRSYHYE